MHHHRHRHIEPRNSTQHATIAFNQHRKQRSVAFANKATGTHERFAVREIERVATDPDARAAANQTANAAESAHYQRTRVCPPRT